MQATFQTIEQQARMLKPKERARLAEVMLESISQPSPSEIEEAWKAEIIERVAAYERGEMKSVPAEEVFRKLEHKKK